jgi:N-sulfoglucosamine sulfohydrolase
MRAVPLLLLLRAPCAAKKAVLFLFEDDGGFALQPYGETTLPTPHLNRLAACGVTFDRAFTSVSSCSPSRASLLSGMPTHESGMYGLCQSTDHFSALAAISTLPNALNAAGVVTGIQGKYHVWGTPPPGGGGSGGVGGAGTFNFSWGNAIGGPGGCQTGASYACPATNYNLVSRNISYMAEQARAFWAHAEAYDAAFYYVGFGDSHRCGGAADGDFCELYGTGGAIPDWTPFVPDPSSLSLPYWIQDTPEARLDYAHMLTAKGRLDQGVGLQLRELALSSFSSSSMLVYFADNGAPFARGKTTFYEAGMGEPLIISLPGGPAGGRTSIVASELDLAPTILAFLGVPVPPTMRGRSLLPVVGAAAGGAAGGGGSACAIAARPGPLLVAPPLHPQLRTAAAAARPPPPPARAPPPPAPLPANFSTAFGSFQSHEVTMYFPTRVVVASDKWEEGASNITYLYKLLYHIAGSTPPRSAGRQPAMGGLNFPVASDLWAGRAFQDLLNRTAAGQPTHWFFNLSTYLGPRESLELYDVLNDPAETTNLAKEPAWKGVLGALVAALGEWQSATSDPWAGKAQHE